MPLEKNKHYFLKINHFGRDLDYKGKVIEVNDEEFRISTEEDPDCRALTLKIKDIISSKEISEPEKEKKTFMIRKRPAKDLKPSVEPDF